MNKKFLILGVLVCILGLVFVSCGGGGGKSDYYGTWVSGSLTPTIELSANKIIEFNQAGEVSIITENLTWLQIDNPNSKTSANYPKGFEISGTITYLNPKGSFFRTSVGDGNRITFYLHNNKASFIISTSGDYVYRKK